MTEPLSLERFAALAEAYGGVVARWPQADRDAAMRMASSDEARAILQDALSLDEALDAWVSPAPSRALSDRIAVTAPAPRRSLATRTRLWWSGIGVATALAGAAAGGIAVAVAAPVDAPSDNSTSFGDIGGQEN